jgi:hypothetical protein
MKNKTSFGDQCDANVISRKKAGAGIKVGGKFTVECYGKDGKLKWVDTIENLVVNVGLYHILDTVLCAGSQVATWYVGLTDGTPTVAAGDDMTTHAGWVEVTAYDEAVRQTYNETRTTTTVSNSASKAMFTISGTTTVGGAFLVSNSTKGGSTGTLLCGGVFTTGDKSLVDNDTLNVQYDFTAADDGV